MDEVGFRVHIAAVGFEVVRLTTPLEMLHAERVILLTKRIDDKAAKYLAKIREILRAQRIRYEVVECNLWDTNEVVGRIGAIVRKFDHHQFYFNASTGPKTACIAGTVAGMLWKVRPYYAEVDYAAPDVHLEGDKPVVGPIQFVPTFDVEELDDASIRALAFLTEKKAVEKHELLDHLKEKGIVKPKSPRKGRKTVTPQAFQAQTDVILRKLERWGYIKTERAGNRLRVVVTERGAHGSKMFQHTIAPIKPPSLLSP